MGENGGTQRQRRKMWKERGKVGGEEMKGDEERGISRARGRGRGPS